MSKQNKNDKIVKTLFKVVHLICFELQKGFWLKQPFQKVLLQFTFCNTNDIEAREYLSIYLISFSFFKNILGLVLADTKIEEIFFHLEKKTI